MKQKAQAGLEYLMTYGWALVLIATVVGVLVFVATPPASQVTFTSSNQAKILLKGGTVGEAGAVEVLAQNITGGKITITGFYASGDFVRGKLNGIGSSSITPSSPIILAGGGKLHFTEIEYVGLGKVDGAINIEYINFAGLAKTVTITASGNSSATAEPISDCGALLLSGKKYVLTQDTATTSSACITITEDNIVLNCQGKETTGNDTGKGIYLNRVSNVIITNCGTQRFYHGVYLSFSSGNTLAGNTMVSNSSNGIHLDSSPYNTVRNNTVSNNTNGIYLTNSFGNLVAGNKAMSNSSNGIHLGSGSSNNTVIGNNAVSNSGNGIYLGSSSNNLVAGNKAMSNSGNGISLINSISNTIRNNVVSSNTKGISLSSSSINTVTGNNLCKNTGGDVSCYNTSSSGTGNTADSDCSPCGFSCDPC